MTGGSLAAANTISPGSLSASSVLTGALPSTIIVRDATVEAIGLLGGTVVDKPEYNILGESNWAPFVLGLKNNNVKFMHMVGEPEIPLFERLWARPTLEVHGIRRFKITGGEPTVRHGIVDLVRTLRRVSGIEDLSLTTNGMLLEDLAGPLRESGLDRVTVSIDSPRLRRRPLVVPVLRRRPVD